jgi:crossover junction endodeoxyribonuclease RuvC
VTRITYIAGIDPGLSGAIALYREDELTIYDMPTHEITTNGKKRRRLDLYALAHWFDLNGFSIWQAVIEDVHAMPGQGVSSSFKFGFVAGAVQAMVAAHFVAVKLVSPRVWKSALKLTADKDASRLRASQIFPKHSHLWARAKDDGRAEAALLAYYGSTLV